MTDLQEHLMQLVTEIDEVCRENDIPYALSGRTAGCAAEFGRFTSKCADFHIMVLAKDVLKLKEMLLKKEISDRGIEDMSDNPQLAYNIVRYVDTGTTLIDKDNPVRFRMLGVAVTIIPLMPDKTSKIIKALEMGTMTLNGAKKIPSARRVSKRKLCISYTKSVRKLRGIEGAAKKIYSAFSKEQDSDINAGGYLWGEDGRKCRVSCDVILNTDLIDFEGKKLPVPKQMDDYLKSFFGKGWKKESVIPLPSANRIAVIADASVPYTEFLKSLQENGEIDMEQLLDDFAGYYQWCAFDFASQEQKVNHKYDYAKRSVSRIDLYCELKDRMHEMREAAEKHDYDTLRKILAPYLSCTKKYYDKGLGFYINQEIFDYASLVWNADGKADYARKVYKKVPQEYKRENLEDFLSKYC